MSSDRRRWALELADAHGIALQFNPFLPGGVPAYKYEVPGNGPVVVLNETLPPERANFSLAHEVAHIILGHTGGVEPEEEGEANRLASELLLPEALFRQHLYMNLRGLKNIFPQASFEVLGRRWLQFHSGVLTIVDDGNLSRRYISDGFSAPPEPVPFEWDIISQTYRDRHDTEAVEEGLFARSTYVDSGPILRVLLTVTQS
jgi:hypothetical protein